MFFVKPHFTDNGISRLNYIPYLIGLTPTTPELRGCKNGVHKTKGGASGGGVSHVS